MRSVTRRCVTRGLDAAVPFANIDAASSRPGFAAGPPRRVALLGVGSCYQMIANGVLLLHGRRA